MEEVRKAKAVLDHLDCSMCRNTGAKGSWDV